MRNDQSQIKQTTGINKEAPIFDLECVFSEEKSQVTY